MTMALDAQFFKPGARVMLRGTVDSSLASRGPYVVRSLIPFTGRKRICRSIRMSSLRLKRFRVELATLSGVILDKIFNPQQLEPIVELDPDENSSSSRPCRVPRVLLSPGTAEETTSPLPRALSWRMLADEAPQEADSHLPPSRCSPEKRPRNCLSNSTADATDSPKEYDILVLGPHHVTNLQLDVLQSGLGELADSIVNGFSYVLSRSNTFPCLSEGSVELPSSLSLACILSAARSPHGQDPDSLTVSVHRFYSLWRRWSERRLVLCPYLQAVSSGEENSNHWILLALSVRSRELWVLDSLGPDPSSVKRLLKLLRLCNQCLLGVKESWSLRTVRHNRQTDDNSCGLFVLGFIRRILGNGGKIPCSITVDIDDVRSYVLETLLTQTAPESSPSNTGAVK